jgi:hypothetical protein
VVRLPLFLEFRRLPPTYGDCQAERADYPERCCPYLSCRHHLYGDLEQSKGARIREFEALLDDPPAEWPHTCSLDVADAVANGQPGTVPHVGDVVPDKDSNGRGVVLRKVSLADLMGLSRERVRQLLLEGLDHARKRPVIAELAGAVDHASDWAFDRGGLAAAVDWMGEP